MTILSTALVDHPVAIFLIVLVIILMAPLLLNKLKIPHIIGMIVAGVVVGPYGFNILADDSSFEIFGEVGLLYLMFLAGIEIDMYHLKLNLKRGLVFGALTFIIPMVMGAVASVYLLKIDWLTSILLASMYASHTLISYPVAARFGITKSPAVLISIVGTIIAVVGALLVLGGAINVYHEGGVNTGAIAWLFCKMMMYCAAVLYVYPRLTRYFFKTYSDNVTQYVYVLAMVLLSALVAKLIGLEAVLGAFFAGLVLNRYIPTSSTLMSRIEFVGNALFIPYFLIGVGMMINVRVIGNVETLWVTAVMLVIALSSKWIAAWGAQKIYKMNGAERDVMFGLTTAHTAVALAVVTIGYNMVLPDGSRMMGETILNGTVLVILVTCAIAPIVTTRAAARIKLQMVENDIEPQKERKRHTSHILIAVSNPLTAGGLVELALLSRPEKRSARDTLYAINVRNDNTPSAKALARSVLDLSVKAAAAAGSELSTIERYDLNTVTGVVNTMEERDITELYIGMHRKATVIDTFLGGKTEQLLKLTNKMVVISRCYIPPNTVTRIVVYVPPKAEFETGFTRWLHMLGNLARELGCRIIFCCNNDSRRVIAGVLRRDKFTIRSEYRQVEDRDDFLLLSTRVLDDDLFVIIGARPASVSFSNDMAELPGFMQKNFSRNNIIVIYPEQFGDEIPMESFSDPLASDISSTPSALRIWGRTFIAKVSNLLHKRDGNKRGKRNKDIKL
ncbi:MAG: cation:proton antiporter [Muribaculaceae bacterium]|nr:cation:proton antiporter [Muribaculaceae bacterium]